MHQNAQSNASNDRSYCSIIHHISHIHYCSVLMLKGTNTQRSGHWVNSFQTELMVEIYSNSLVRAIGKV